MQIQIADCSVLISGRVCSYFTLREGQRVLCQRTDMACGATVIELRHGELTAEGFCQERWGELCVLRPSAPSWRSRPTVQQSAEINGATVQCTAVCEPDCTVVWLDGAQSATATLPIAKAVDITFLPELLAVAVGCRQEDSTYLALVDVTTFGVLYEGWVDRYEAKGAQVHVICAYADMQQHRLDKTLGYRGTDFCTLAHRFICQDAHTYMPDMVPYLFAEALAIGAMEEAKTYVEDELREAWADLTAYIGEIKTVCAPPVYVEEPLAVGIVDKQGQGKILAMTMNGRLIADIRRVE